MLENIERYEQNSIRIGNIYFDPYLINKETHDADIIFITHSHYDHFSVEDIAKLKNDNTFLVITKDCLDSSLKMFDKDKILIVEPNNEYNIGKILFKTITMYNINKEYHPKEKEWVGYLINKNNYTYYIVGDSDNTEELQNVKCDVLFIPIGGIYTMTIDEAVEATIKVNPNVVIPTHYGTIVGSYEDGNIFKNKIPNNIKCVILQK